MTDACRRRCGPLAGRCATRDGLTTHALGIMYVLTYPVESDRGKKDGRGGALQLAITHPRGSSLALGVLELVASGAALPQAVGRLIFLDLR